MVSSTSSPMSRLRSSPSGIWMWRCLSAGALRASWPGWSPRCLPTPCSGGAHRHMLCHCWLLHHSSATLILVLLYPCLEPPGCHSNVGLPTAAGDLIPDLELLLHWKCILDLGQCRLEGPSSACISFFTIRPEEGPSSWPKCWQFQFIIILK